MKKEKPVDIADVLREMRESLEKVNDSIEGMKKELKKKM
jgi:hypothetical protein